ncbi:hypothetical protein QVD17_01565 [Tagetes erecta]|uniref:Uncharacterized protein n=1 Tax=Tagetes erecta TaxID=13708 RepID=A0AAD8P8E8_TARER|nr:hypothetical protein QVD17_01565 [Tagetes erecta]
MKLMTNIVKVSYISIAKLGFRSHGPPHTPLVRPTPNPARSFVRYPRNLISSETTVSNYLIHPGDINKPYKNMIQDDESDVDTKAWDFIKKVREKNMKDANEMTDVSELILPPPPPPPRIMRRSLAAY